MPIIVPRKVIPIEQAQAAASTLPTLTEDDVRALLAAQAGVFDQQIQAVTAAFSSALAAASHRPNDKTVTGWNFVVEYDLDRTIKTIRATALN